MCCTISAKHCTGSALAPNRDIYTSYYTLPSGLWFKTMTRLLTKQKPNFQPSKCQACWLQTHTNTHAHTHTRTHARTELNRLSFNPHMLVTSSLTLCIFWSNSAACEGGQCIQATVRQPFCATVCASMKFILLPEDVGSRVFVIRITLTIHL